MPGIVFLVQNGVGFGHIRRTLLIASEIRRLSPKTWVGFISQAGSLLPFQGTDFPVVNFPFFHRLPSAAADHAYRISLETTLDELEPDLVVEDTYPDSWYGGCRSLTNTPRALVLRRIEPDSFDEFRRHGEFATFDRILIAQDRADFFAEAHSGPSASLVALSDRFQFVGHIFHRSSAADRARLRARYAATAERLVVVSAGAGGTHINERYPERLFTSMAAVARRTRRSGMRLRFAFVLGPYYAGKRIDTAPNVTVTEFEPDLSALLQCADVAVIRPGSNVLYESLAGDANLVVVPGLTYREHTHAWYKWLAQHHRVSICAEPRADILFEHVLGATRGVRRRGTGVDGGQSRAAKTLLGDLIRLRSPGIVTPGTRVCVILGGVRAEYHAKLKSLTARAVPSARVIAPAGERDMEIVTVAALRAMATSRSRADTPQAVLVDGSREGLPTAEELRSIGIRLVCRAHRNHAAEHDLDACALTGAEPLGIIVWNLSQIDIDRNATWVKQLSYRVSRQARREPCVGIYFACEGLARSADVGLFIKALRSWIGDTRVQPISPAQAATVLAEDRLMGLSGTESHFEIDRLS